MNNDLTKLGFITNTVSRDYASLMSPKKNEIGRKLSRIVDGRVMKFTIY